MEYKHFCNILVISITLQNGIYKTSSPRKTVNWAGKYFSYFRTFVFFLKTKLLENQCETFRIGREFRDHQGQYPVFMDKKMDVKK